MVHAFYFKDSHYCPTCVVEVLIAAGLVHSSARDDEPVAVLTRVSEEKGIDSAWPDAFTNFEYPKVIFPVPGDLQCEGCGSQLLDASNEPRTPVDEADAVKGELINRLLELRGTGSSPAGACLDLVVLTTFSEVLTMLQPRYIHQALMAGAPLPAVIEASGLRPMEVHLAWHLWAKQQLRGEVEDGLPQVSNAEIQKVLGIFARQ